MIFEIEGSRFRFHYFFIDIIILNILCNLGQDIGKAKRIYCTKYVNYGRRGIIALTDHVKTQGHVKQLITRKTNYVIPGYSNADDQSYGIHPVYQSLLNPKELKSNSSLNVPSRDTVPKMEAMV